MLPLYKITIQTNYITSAPPGFVRQFKNSLISSTVPRMYYTYKIFLLNHSIIENFIKIRWAI